MATRLSPGTPVVRNDEPSSPIVDDLVRGGFPDRTTAEYALRSVLGVLGERLTDDEASALAARLPESLARIIDQAEYDGDFDHAEFYERVRRREKTGPGVGREHADIVLRAIGEHVDAELRGRLVRVLPVEVGRRLVPAEYGEPPHLIGRHAPALSTLAHGRPGSRHPLSEAAPPSGHAHSVAQSDDPHAQTRLASARGLTQERERESLATGRPPMPLRPISESGDD